MDRKASSASASTKKNKYLVPIIVVSVLLAIALSLLLVLFFGSRDDDSVSKGNVVGGNKDIKTAVTGDTLLSVTKEPSLLRYIPMPATLAADEKLTLSRWTGYDAEEKFSVSGMMPGDTYTKEYKLTVNSKNPKCIYFDVNITKLSVLSEALQLKVEVDGEELYSGLFAEMEQLTYEIPSGNASASASASASEFTYKLTVSLPKSAGNKYAMKSLTADFEWSFEEKSVTPPSDPSSDTHQTASARFGNIFIVGEKIIDGDTPEDEETFTFLLECKNDYGEYETIGTATSDGSGSFDLSNAISSFVFNRKGLYNFRVTEVAGDTKGMEYDSSEKTFQIFLSDANIYDKLKIIEIAGVSGVKVSYDEDADRYDLSVTFTNKFTKVPGSEPPDDNNDGEEDILEVVIGIENETQVIGSGDAQNSELAFAIENIDNGEKEIVLTDENGKASFTLCFDRDDVGVTKKYKVYAIADAEPGVTYSDKVYEITVTVSTDEVTQQLVPIITVDGETVRAEDVKLSFVTVSTYEQDLIPEITITFIILVIEILILVYMIRDKKKKLGSLKLNSFASPVIFLGPLVPLWQAVVLVALVVATLAMLVVDIVYFVRSKKEKNEALSKEEDNERP